MSCTFEARVLAYYKLSPVKILQMYTSFDHFRCWSFSEWIQYYYV